MVELSAGASVAIGVLVGLLSTSIQSVGLTLQRKSHLLEDQKEEHHTRRAPWRRRRWQIGMSLFLIANLVGSTIQITTLPLPVLSTLQASGLVFNTLCATVLLHEPFTVFSAVGTFLVAAGAVLIGIFGSVTEPSHNLHQLLHLLSRGEFLGWLFATLALVCGIIVMTWFLKRIFPRETARLKLIRGMSFGCISGILSAHCLLIAKSAVELLVRTIVDKNNQFSEWQSWIILLGLVVFALSQLYYLHRGLKLCSTSVLYPFVFCIYNIIAILDGLIYFNQSARLSPLQGGLIALGTVILLTGVLALSWRLDDERDDHGRRRRASTLARARVATPQSALTPGMGFVEAPISPTDEDDTSYFSPGSASAATDEESGLPGARRGSRPKATEQTPLLRHVTAPALDAPVSKKRKTRWRPGRAARRYSIADEVDREDLWDELNDRESRRHSLHAKRSSRPNSGLGKKVDSVDFAKPLSDSAEDGDVEESDGTGESRPLGMGQTARRRRWSVPSAKRRTSQEGADGTWFKLKWWKRRWKRDRDENEGEGDGGAGSSSSHN